MKQHIAIGVARQSLRVVKLEPANMQRYATLESMRVIAESDASIHDLKEFL
jgi:hypothetical protein